MSNQPRTPHRTIRVRGSLWKAAQEKAAKEGTTVSEVLRDALERYVQEPDTPRSPRVVAG
jgi:predicted DNA binding CopG/RHH family protein